VTKYQLLFLDQFATNPTSGKLQQKKSKRLI
jgi:hypothetical protein